jgi:predicted kinase
MIKNSEKTVLLLRACSGSGKSTFAEYLKYITTEEKSVTICCADDYMVVDGEYKFSVDKLSYAHSSCQKKYEQALINHDDLIIVANTNTKERDFKFYLDKAEEYDYTVFSIVLENRHGNKNVHNVPDVTLKNQAEAIKNSLKLI